MPCSGPRYFPAAISWSACCACGAPAHGQRDHAAQPLIVARAALEVDARQPLAAQAAVSIQRDSFHTGAKAMSASAGGSPPVARAAREVLALRDRTVPGSSGSK